MGVNSDDVFSKSVRSAPVPGVAIGRTFQRQKLLVASKAKSIAVAEDGHTPYFENIPEEAAVIWSFGRSGSGLQPLQILKTVAGIVSGFCLSYFDGGADPSVEFGMAVGK